MTVQKVKLITGIIYNPKINIKSVEKELSDSFGEFDYISKAIPFTYTDYYTDEMGTDLIRKFLSFKQLIDPSRLAEIKNRTCEIENSYRIKGDRKVNIDPGYMESSKLVLASTKNFFQRIYLKNGIYAEVTMYWRNKKFNFLEWTYPDYKSPEYIEVLKNIRNIYMAAIKKENSCR